MNTFEFRSHCFAGWQGDLKFYQIFWLQHLQVALLLRKTLVSLFLNFVTDLLKFTAVRSTKSIFKKCQIFFVQIGETK